MRNGIVIVLLAIVLLIPLLEFFDQGIDLNPYSDLVRALVCAFVATTLCLSCRKVVSFLPRLFGIVAIPRVPVCRATVRLSEPAAFADESPLLVSNLRI
jgi:hypothetical protein